MGEVFHYETSMFVLVFVLMLVLVLVLALVLALVLVLSETALVLVIGRYAIHSNQELKIKLMQLVSMPARMAIKFERFSEVE